MLHILNEDNGIESQRDAVIRGLILYLGEKPEEFIQFYQIVDDNDAAAIQEALTTLVLSKGPDKQTGIAMEGAEVLFGICDVAHACAYLMSLMYALELSYPKKLKYPFEVCQKIFLKLEDVNKRMSSKVHHLKVSLHA
ncbi:uncharacterized protein KZ484_009820 [Pholidichthys leucotaenia]